MKDTEKKIQEAIEATYPRDIWPDVSDDKRAKDGVVANCMRDMSKAIASIAYQVVEPLLAQAESRGREDGRREVLEVAEGMRTYPAEVFQIHGGKLPFVVFGGKADENEKYSIWSMGYKEAIQHILALRSRFTSKD